MPKASRFSGHLDPPIGKIARRIRKRMQELGLNEGEFASDCHHLGLDLFSDEEKPRLSRERISKMRMNCKSQPQKSAAKVISSQELRVMAAALKVSTDWLTERQDNRDPVLWDILADPRRAQNLIHLMAEHEEKSANELIWAEGLLCSLTPAQFIHKYHQAHFAEMDKFGLTPEKEKLVRVYDHVGNMRRELLFKSGSKRKWELTQLIFLSELERIANGSGKYRSIEKSLRRKCLVGLAETVGDASLGISLVVARDDDAVDLKEILSRYERLGTNGDQFTLWTHHWGMVGWSEHADHIRQNGKLLAEFQKRAKYREREEVKKLLLRLAEKVK